MKEINKIFKIFFIYLFALTVQVESKILSMGNPDAKVIVKVFSSLTCPHCANFHATVIPKIIKNYVEIDSAKIPVYLRENPEVERENIDFFLGELKDLEVDDPAIICFGGEAHKIVSRNLKKRFHIFKVPHYATYMSKEVYREKIKRVIDDWISIKS